MKKTEYFAVVFNPVTTESQKTDLKDIMLSGWFVCRKDREALVTISGTFDEVMTTLNESILFYPDGENIPKAMDIVAIPVSYEDRLAEDNH